MGYEAIAQASVRFKLTQLPETKIDRKIEGMQSICFAIGRSGVEKFMVVNR